jgi:hypothetical protein
VGLLRRGRSAPVEPAETFVEDRPWNDPALDAAVDRLGELPPEGVPEHVLGYLAPLRGQVEKHVQALGALADRLTDRLDVLRERAAAAGDDAETAADARAVLGWALVARGWEVRTGDRAHNVGEDQWRRFGILLGEADEVLTGALEARPNHPAAAVARMQVALGVGVENATEFWERFEVATHDRATLYPAHTMMLTSMCRKWYGSNEIMFDFARKVAASAPPGDPVSAVLPLAQIEYLNALVMFKEEESGNRARALQLARNEDLPRVAEASRRWCGDGTQVIPPHPRDVLAHQLFGWFLSLDKAYQDRARWHLQQAGTRIAFLPWSYLGRPHEEFAGLRSKLKVTS